MALQTIELDPNAVAYTDDEIVGKINTASVSAVITRASSVSGVAFTDGAAKENLDAMPTSAREYVKTEPVSGDYRVYSIAVKNPSEKLVAVYDDVPAT